MAVRRRLGPKALYAHPFPDSSAAACASAAPTWSLLGRRSRPAGRAASSSTNPTGCFSGTPGVSIAAGRRFGRSIGSDRARLAATITLGSCAAPPQPLVMAATSAIANRRTRTGRPTPLVPGSGGPNPLRFRGSTGRHAKVDVYCVTRGRHQAKRSRLGEEAPSTLREDGPGAAPGSQARLVAMGWWECRWWL